MHPADYEIILSERAEREIDAIGAWIARDSPANALAVTTRLLAAIDRLRTMPRRHPLAPEAGHFGVELRQRVVRPYRIFEVTLTAVVVHTVRHSARRPARDLRL